MTVTYTVGQLTDDTTEHLQGTTREQLNILAADLSSSTANATDTVQMSYGLAGAVAGSYLSINDETMFVLEVLSQNAQTVAVLRGQKDSDPVAQSSGSIIQVDPSWPRYTVMKTLRDEIRSWGPQVFQIATEDIAIDNSIRGYDLGSITPYFRILDVRMTPPPYIGQPGFVDYPGGVQSDESWPPVPWEEMNGTAPTSDFPSGSALILSMGATNLTSSGSLHVIYAKPFDVDTSWGDSTDCIANIGMDPTDLDIAPYGAAWRLLSFREVRRTFTSVQGQPRDASEVPALSIMQAAQGFKALRDSRLGDAQIRLSTKYPLRTTAL